MKELIIFLYVPNALIVFLIGYYVFAKDSKRKTNLLFFLMSIAATVWGISIPLLYIFVPNYTLYSLELMKIRQQILVSPDAWKMLIFENINFFAVLFLPAFFCHLSLVITRREDILKRKLAKFLLYIFPLLLGLIALFHDFYLVLPGRINSIVNPIYREFFQANIVNIIFPFYFEGLLLGSLYFLIKGYSALKSKQEKSKLKYLIIGALVPGIGGSFVSFFLPMLFTIVGYGWLSFPIFAVGYLFVGEGIIQKSLFVDYQEILNIIFKRLSELVIITDREGIIILTNDVTPKKLNFKREEMIGTNIKELLGQKEESFLEIKKMLKKKDIYKGEILFLTKDKIKTPYLLTASQTKEGIIFVGRDIESLLEHQKKLEMQVKERTGEIRQRAEELEKFYKLAVGRELKMMELKKEIEELKKEFEERQ